MAILGGLFGNFSSGGIGNSNADKSTDTDNRNYAATDNGVISTPSFTLGDKNKIGGSVTSNVNLNVTNTDYGAVASSFGLVDSVIAESVGIVDGAINAFLDLTSIASADNLAQFDRTASLAESSMYLVSDANNNVTSLAADSLNNAAYLSDSVITSTEALGSQFGQDLTYLADSSMQNNAILVDKTIDTVDLLTTQQQLSLNEYGQGLKSQAEQFSADVGFLSQQSIQGNNELTSLFGSYLADNSNLVNTSLLELANLQEQGLDSALQVAGNVALNDNVEGIQNMTKYAAIAFAVGMIAYSLRSAK